jgi:hypothetical protein
MREGDNLEDPGLDERIILKWIFREVGFGGGGTDGIDLAYDRDRCWAIVNAVMNLLVPQNAGNFLSNFRRVRFSRRTRLHDQHSEFGRTATMLIIKYLLSHQQGSCRTHVNTVSVGGELKVKQTW